MSKTRLFTQAELNDVMAYERRKVDAKIAAMEVERGKCRASEDELTDKLASLGVTLADGETLTDAAHRYIATAEADESRRDAEREAAAAQATADHEAAVAPILAEIEQSKGRLTDHTIVTALERAACHAGAYDPKQVVSLYRDKARLLENGEVVLKDAIPQFLHSPNELCDYLKCDPASANLFMPAGR